MTKVERIEALKRALKTDNSIEIAVELWNRFENVPIDDNEIMQERFLFFPAGTDRNEIFHWFEDTFDLSVAGDLMFKGGRESNK